MDREEDRMVHSSRAEQGAAEEALHQCQLIQNLVDISISSLRALRTRCAASNDLTQREIRTLEGNYGTAPSSNDGPSPETDKTSTDLHVERCKSQLFEVPHSVMIHKPFEL
ncbi:Kinase suppressor of Ras 2, partial [Nibea albiflora]